MIRIWKILVNAESCSNVSLLGFATNGSGTDLQSGKMPLRSGKVLQRTTMLILLLILDTARNGSIHYLPVLFTRGAAHNPQ